MKDRKEKILKNIISAILLLAILATDMFYFLSGKEYYSELVHTTGTADFPREMLNLSNSSAKRAYSNGSLSHAASDITGHTQYINPVSGGNVSDHELIEIGVDAQVMNKLNSLYFSVPYEMLQKAYNNTYGANPRYRDIYKASRNMMAAMFIEKYLADNGKLDGLKNRITGWEPVYNESVNYTRIITTDPLLLPNLDLNTGAPALEVSSGKTGTVKLDERILNTTDKLIKNKIIEVHIRNNKHKKVLHVKYVEILDRVKFEEEMNRLVGKFLISE